MSVETRTRKRKSGDDVVSTAKKVKTTISKSADKPAPLKSALKKSKVEKVEKEEKPKGKKTTTKKAKEVVEEPADDEADTIVSDNEEGGAALTADQTEALLAGFSSDSEDEAEDGIDVSKLPAAPTAGEVQKKIKAATDAHDPESTPGVVFLGRIPHGFYEPQMRSYFSQFGTISHLRLGRNKHTGKSQHHAFVEFESAAVADIVAKTMDKYLLFGHILQCRRVPAEQVKENMWKVGGIKKGKVRPRNRIEGTKLRKGMQREGWEKRISKEEERREKKKGELEEMGYEFEMPGLKKVESVPVKAKAIEDAKAGAGEEGGVKLIEGKKEEVAPGVEQEVEKVVEAEPEGVVEGKTVKRKSKATGATTTTKKRKTKIAA